MRASRHLIEALIASDNEMAQTHVLQIASTRTLLAFLLGALLRYLHGVTINPTLREQNAGAFISSLSHKQESLLSMSGHSTYDGPQTSANRLQARRDISLEKSNSFPA
jgi:hypothetical protein